MMLGCCRCDRAWGRLRRGQSLAVGRYTGDPTPEQLTRYFHLSPTDLTRVRRRRSPATQLGYGVQLGTVRFLGTFAAVAATPRSAVAEIADS